MSYYQNKTEALLDIFAARQVSIHDDTLFVDGRQYPIVDDVIILLEPSKYTRHIKELLGSGTRGVIAKKTAFAEDIQYTFGEEWKIFDKILEEHEKEFRQYFDLVEIGELKDSKVCDLGCGIGRWSYFLRHHCRELVLVDFSDAIFVARRNLRDAPNALFFMADIKELPFRDDFSDLIFCLGVLHHLPDDALHEVRALRKFAPRLLIYLYYSLDNRPFYFKIMLAAVNILRKRLSHFKSKGFRSSFTWLASVLIYLPLIWVGKLLRSGGLAKYVPLYEGYNEKSLKRIRQDVYDRFFTRIEQRFSRHEIMKLTDNFQQVVVSNELPYWHFLCRR